MRIFAGIILLLLGTGDYKCDAQVWNPNIGQTIDNPQLNAIKLLTEFESLGTKEPGTLALENTSLWIDSVYKELGYTHIRFDSFSASGHLQRNVVVKKQGNTDDYILIGSHYDTKTGPGVNDNGTGVVASMMAASVLKNLTSDRTVYFVHFSDEESGFKGSSHFVNNYIPSIPGKLILMVNLDQLGGTIGQTGNDKIFCERDEISSPPDNNLNSARYTDTIANLCEIYTTLQPVIGSAYSSDYLPFETKGHVITGLFQFSSFPQRHSIKDSLKYLDTNSFKEAVKLSSALAIHFAKIPRFISSPDITSQHRFYVNNEYLYTDLSGEFVVNIYSISGKQVKSVKGFGSSDALYIGPLEPGIYYFQSLNNDTVIFSGKFAAH